MALDLEEQEQVAALKGWWSEHGTLVTTLVVGIALAVAGWQGWRWYEGRQTAQAAALFDALARGGQAGDPKAVRDAAGGLIEDHPRTLYAAMGALVAARFHFDRGDLKSAKLQLGWAAENARSDELRDLARLRLAGLLLDEKAHDEALKLLEAKHGAPFAAQYLALRGDVLTAKNQAAEARAAYKSALELADKARDNSAFRESVRMRLEALGG